MSISKIAAAAGLMFGFSALAIPHLNGTFTCKNQNGSVQIQLQTRDNQLYVNGLDQAFNTGDLVNATSGIPCENKTEKQDIGGASLSATISCDSKSLGMKLSMNAPAEQTVLDLGIKFTEVSASQVDISVNVSGTSSGSPQSVSGTVSCTK